MGYNLGKYTERGSILVVRAVVAPLNFCFFVEMNSSELYSLYLQHPQVTTDTRNITVGSIFFALKGANFDANTFAAEALEKGAAYVVIDDPNYQVNERCILVADVLTALQDLARYHRRQLTIPVVGITGTNGKTTTKELLYAVLSQGFKVLATQGNLNNHIGVPLTILSIKKEHEMAIIEMGANHQQEIEFLCSMSMPSHGLITNVGKAHLEGFGGFEGVKKTKRELYVALQGNNGVIFYPNTDQELKALLPGSGEQIPYEQFVQVSIAGQVPFLSVDADFATEKCRIDTHLAGAYNLNNLAAAMAVGRFFQLSAERIRQGIEGYVPSNNRSQIVETGKNRVIMDAYNANPSSMQAALENFAVLPADKKAVILGDMFELGDVAAQEHEHLVSWLKKAAFEKVFLSGKEFKAAAVGTSLQAFTTTEELASVLGKEMLSGYLILVKGSRGMKLESVKDLL